MRLVDGARSGQSGRVETEADEPDDAAVRCAAADLRRIATTGSWVTLGCGGLVLVGFPLAALGVPFLAFMAWGFGFTFGSLYAIAWRRAAVARSRLQAGDARAVWAVGWCRPPDGCNYALFVQASSETPHVVVRLPLRRDMERSSAAWVYGSLKPAMLGGLALLGSNGLLATGRVVSSRAARRKWQRFDTTPSIWVQRPPENWMPPAGK